MRYLVFVEVGTIWKLRSRRKDAKACQYRHLLSLLAYTYHGESVRVAVYDDESLVISVIPLHRSSPLRPYPANQRRAG